MTGILGCIIVLLRLTDTVHPGSLARKLAQDRIPNFLASLKSLPVNSEQSVNTDQSVNSITDDDAGVFGFLFSGLFPFSQFTAYFKNCEALEQGSRIRDRLEEPDGVYPADRGADHLHRVENDGPPDVQVQQHRELKGNPVGIRMPGHRMPKHIEPYSN